MNDLVVDGQIRLWVFLPIVLMTFLMGLIRHYLSLLLKNTRKIDLKQTKDQQLLQRLRLFRKNAIYLPKNSYTKRLNSFLYSTEFNLSEKKNEPKNIDYSSMDPAIMTDLLKGNATNVIPMVIIGTIINWLFSGFITTRVPFPLTRPFKSMLQKGIELTSLDASWVSSPSWYFLNAFGLRYIYSLLLGEDNEAAENIQEHTPTMGHPRELSQKFKIEWEGLNLMNHTCVLDN